MDNLASQDNLESFENLVNLAIGIYLLACSMGANPAGSHKTGIEGDGRDLWSDSAHIAICLPFLGHLPRTT